MSGSLIFCWVGKTAAEYAKCAEREYLGRIGRYCDARVLTVAEERHDGTYSPAHRMEREGRKILDKLSGVEPACVIVLDPAAKQMRSRDFAERVRAEAYDAGRNVVFVVGGPDGISSLVRQRADWLLGLSEMTLPHDLARVVLLEQAYRALTIINGHPYDR